MHRWDEMMSYIESQYKLAWSDFECASIKSDREKQWEARREIARLENLVAEVCGFRYVDYLKRRCGRKSSEVKDGEAARRVHP